MATADGTQKHLESPRREIAIFWDFENVHLPSWANPADASRAIVSAVSKYGRIVDRRLYFDMQGTSNGNSSSGGYHWSALDSSGFDLVNTPRRNQKETLDKKLIADVLTFAWDSAVRNDHCKPCVVLLTSDGDYAYTLCKLRDRGVMSVVMYGADSSVADILKDSADIPLSFEGDVLSTIQGGNSSKNTNSKPTPHINSTSIDDDALHLCTIALRELARSSHESSNDGWLLGSKLAVPFRTAFFRGDQLNVAAREAFKDRYRQARELAIQRGWMERGHKLLTGPDQGKVIVTSMNRKAHSGTSEKLSLEDFCRVTLQGHGVVNGKATSTDNVTFQGQEVVNRKPISTNTATSKSRLFIKNIPNSVRIQDLVRFLENEHNAKVIRGQTFKGPPKAPFIFGSVELTSELDAERLLQLAKDSKISYHGRILEVNYDGSRPKISSPNINSEYSYERSSRDTIEESDSFYFCQALSDFTKRSGNDNRVDDWTDGGFFHLVKSQGGIPLFGGERDRIKKARTIAIEKMYVEAGRRVKITGDIEVVTREATDFSRHKSELYVRLTPQGHRFLDERNRANGNKVTQGYVQYLFIKNLPVNVEVKELLHFFECVHNCPVVRTMIEATKPGSSSGQAHLELASVGDAAKVLKMAACSDGLIFRDRSLLVLPDQRVPTYPGNDPERSYEKDGAPVADNQEKTNFDSSEITKATSPTETEVSAQDGPLLLCRVIYEKCLKDNFDGDSAVLWMDAGTIAAEFQMLLRLDTAEERKENYKKNRHAVVSTGLVEVGRRVLSSNKREIKPVPCITGGRPAPNLSLETYIRLTTKGVDMVLSSPRVLGHLMTPRTASKNLFIQNLPRDTDIHDFVTYFESNYCTILRRACLDNIHPLAKSASIHIEIENIEDVPMILKAGKDQGFVYGGRALTWKTDKYVPKWSTCKKLHTYEKVAKKDDKEDDKSNNLKEKDSGASEMNLKDHPALKEGNTLESTNLLFGDNLALLYAQGAKMTGSPNTSLIETETSMLSATETHSSQDGIVDLLWE